MAAAEGPEEMRYEMCFCESTDAVAPGSASLRGWGLGLNKGGWRSIRRPQYPVEVGLIFEGRVKMQKITITCHESAIPSAIEMSAGSVVQRASTAMVSARHTQADYATASFVKLGVTRPDTNKRSVRSTGPHTAGALALPAE
jgi:hypothetical protein